MTPPKTARNARIVRLREHQKHLSWTEIANLVSREFSEYDDDGKLLIIKRQRAQQIYASETK